MFSCLSIEGYMNFMLSMVGSLAGQVLRVKRVI